MDKRRAKEIAVSPNMINVTYNGEPIYIQSVNEQNETANIHPLGQHDKQQEVSVTSLKED